MQTTLAQNLRTLRADSEVFIFLFLVMASSFIALVLTPFVPIYLVKVHGLSEATVGAMFGLTYLITSPAALIAGFCVDRWGAMTVLWVSLLLMAGLPLTIVSGLDYRMVGVGFVLLVAGKTGSMVSLVYLVFKSRTESYSRVLYSAFYASTNVAVIVAPLIYLYLSDPRLITPSYVAMALVVGSLLSLLFFNPGNAAAPSAEDVETESRPSEKPTATQPDPRPPQRLYLLVAVHIIGLLYSVLYNNLYVTVPLNVDHITLAGVEIYPLLLSLNGILVIILQYVYLHWSERRSQSFQMLFGVATLSLSYALLAMMMNAGGLLVFIIIFTVAEAFIDPTRATLTNRYTRSASRGLNNGLTVAAGGVSGLGIYLSVLWSDWYGFQGTLWLWAGIGLIMTFIAVSIFRTVHFSKEQANDSH